MTFEDNKMLELNQYRLSDKAQSIIYVDLEPLIENVDGWKNNPERLSTTKVGEHVSCGYSISTIWKFDRIENKYDV